jgi:hypothetical protein
MWRCSAARWTARLHVNRDDAAESIAMAKSFKDPGFPKEFQKLTGGVPEPISGDLLEAAIKEIPRDPETVALYKHLADHRPMPPR